MATLRTLFVAPLLILVAMSASCGTSLSTPPSDWETSSPAAAGLDPTKFTALTSAIDSGNYPKTTSVLIVFRGQFVYEHYFGAGTPDLLNDTRSAMKVVTGLAVGAAIRDGIITGADAPAFSYLRDLKPFQNDTPLKRAITIEDLLTMSSALTCNDNVDDSPGNEDRMHEQKTWTRWAVDLPTQADYVRDASGRGPFAYCTANAFLLGQILQRAAHRPVDQYIEQKIWLPLSISKWEWPRSPIGEVMTGGGLRLRSRDIAKLAWMMASGGNWQGQNIVPPGWVTATLTSHRVASPDQTYGYLSYQRRYKTKCGVSEAGLMAGNGGSVALVLRDEQTAIVITRQNYNVRGTAQETTDLVEKYILPAIACASHQN